MKNLSRGTWLTIAAVAAIPATVAIAKSVDHAGWRMTPETRARIEDGKLAMVKTALQLNADQEKLWAPVEEQVREAFKSRESRRAEWMKKREERKAEKSDKADGQERKRPDLAQRFEKMSERLSQRADRLKAFSGAFTPFYASLSDEQKDVLRPLMRELGPGFGGPPRGHRWAFGGWGPGGRHHGWHGEHGGPGGMGGPGGPGMQDDDGPGNDDGGPAQPGEPDKKG